MEECQQIMKKHMSKTLYLIRHAESEENVHIANAADGWKRMKRFSLPNRTNIGSVFALASFQSDAPLSETGQKQVEFVASAIQSDDFLAKYSPQLHVHSPLQRARETHMGLFPDCERTELECLKEITATEYLFSPSRKALRQRIANFENWLRDRPETSIVAVGHSQYFRLMLGTETVMDNCTVLRCTFNPDLDGDEKWIVHETLYSIDREGTSKESR